MGGFSQSSFFSERIKILLSLRFSELDSSEAMHIFRISCHLLTFSRDLIIFFAETSFGDLSRPGNMDTKHRAEQFWHYFFTFPPRRENYLNKRRG